CALEHTALVGSQRAWSHRAALHGSPDDGGGEWIRADRDVAFKRNAIDEWPRAAGFGQLDPRATAELRRGYRDRFEQHSMRQVTRPTVEVVNDVVARVVAEDVERVLCPKHETPRLRVVAARRPAREIEHVARDGHRGLGAGFATPD